MLPPTWREDLVFHPLPATQIEGVRRHTAAHVNSEARTHSGETTDGSRFIRICLIQIHSLFQSFAKKVIPSILCYTSRQIQNSHLWMTFTWCCLFGLTGTHPYQQCQSLHWKAMFVSNQREGPLTRHCTQFTDTKSRRWELVKTIPWILSVTAPQPTLHWDSCFSSWPFVGRLSPASFSDSLLLPLPRHPGSPPTSLFQIILLQTTMYHPHLTWQSSTFDFWTQLATPLHCWLLTWEDFLQIAISQ